MDVGELEIEKELVHKKLPTKLFVGLITLYILLSVLNQRQDSELYDWKKL
ncbi:unnamed protein product [Brassica rapa]|uniref:Uncharacterized protein n=1 Tax=Brassica campestris TaxID=3711 RepID=A0A8D9LV08_BRACM|nr:unnamed protein product [Brassica rapa]